MSINNIEFIEFSRSSAEVQSNIWLNDETINMSPQKEKGWLLSFFVKCSMEQAWDFLNSAEQSMQSVEHILIAVVERDEWFEFYWYASSPKGHENRIRNMMGSHNSIVYDSQTLKDRDWGYFKKMLYPKKDELLEISNKRAVADMLEAGVLIENIANVEYYSYFKSETLRQKAVKDAKNSGFELLELYVDESGAKYPQAATFAKMHTLQLDELTKESMQIYSITKMYDGVFDGWELREENA